MLLLVGAAMQAGQRPTSTVLATFGASGMWVVYVCKLDSCPAACSSPGLSEAVLVQMMQEELDKLQESLVK